jgi:hypothetical protein
MDKPMCGNAGILSEVEGLCADEFTLDDVNHAAIIVHEHRVDLLVVSSGPFGVLTWGSPPNVVLGLTATQSCLILKKQQP